MKAIVRREFGEVDVLGIKEIPEPEPKEGFVNIEVKAFGINRAETYMRRGKWDHAAEVSGIECAGIVKDCPGGEFKVGTKVVAMMGGLGRLVNGSYAEVTQAPVTNVVSIETNLPWAELAAIPESYVTAWFALYGNLEIEKGQTLVIRGATSALGQAALNIAHDAGLKCIALSRSEKKFELLRSLGADRVDFEKPDLSETLPETKQIDRVLDLVGNTTLLDSLRLVKRRGDRKSVV